jgi:hypothetical protein
MPTLDDPVLALIARFVESDSDNLSNLNEAFLRSQVETINSHIKDAPHEQRQHLALTWIKEHAEQYRQYWLKNTLSRCATVKQCNDCPILHNSKKEYCNIHSEWVILLNEYVTDKIDSEKYIDETLHVLNQHKNELKVSAVFQ